MGSLHPLRLAALSIGLISLVSLLIAPAAAFLSLVSGVLLLPVALSFSRASTVLPAIQISISLTSLYFFSEAVVFSSPESLATGTTLAVLSLLMVYVEIMILALSKGIGILRLLLLLATAAITLHVYREVIPRLINLLGETAYSSLDPIAYSGIIYIGAGLPHSSLILFSLVFLIYDLLRSAKPQKPLQTA